MTGLLVGADVGGSKTAVAVSDGERILARASGRGAAVRPGRALPSAATIAEVVRLALGEIGRRRAGVLVVGAAGAGRAPERDELQAALRSEDLAERVLVTTDIEIALAAAFGDGPGLVLSAGTGSVAVARAAGGTLHRVGGYGWQMGDEGSGYAIGRAALGAVSRAQDGRGPDTALTARLLAATRSASFDDLVRWAAGASPAEVAGLAPAALEVAAAGDPVAQGIADSAARELAELARRLLPKLEGISPVRVALTGGLLDGSATLRRAVLARLARESGLQPIEGTIEAALGAVHLAKTVSGEQGAGSTR